MGWGEGGLGTVTLHPREEIEGWGGRGTGVQGLVERSEALREDEGVEGREGGKRSEKEEEDGATEVWQGFAGRGDDLVVTAS